MKSKITGAGWQIEPDKRDEDIMAERVRAFNKLPGPRVGDYVLIDGVLNRFSHDWVKSIQTSKDGSFYMGDGSVSFSGGLDPAINKTRFELTDQKEMGDFWFFHNDFWGTGRGVYFQTECRVYKLNN